MSPSSAPSQYDEKHRSVLKKIEKDRKDAQDVSGGGGGRGGGARLPYENDGSAHRKFLKNPLKSVRISFDWRGHSWIFTPKRYQI